MRLFWQLQKAKPYPIGTIRTWNGVKYKKVSDKEWKIVSGQKTTGKDAYYYLHEEKDKKFAASLEKEDEDEKGQAVQPKKEEPKRERAEGKREVPGGGKPAAPDRPVVSRKDDGEKKAGEGTDRYKADKITLSRPELTQFPKHNYIPEDIKRNIKQHGQDYINLAMDKYELEGAYSTFCMDGTGSGKTRQALGLAASYLAKHTEVPILIVTQNTRVINQNFTDDAKAMGVQFSRATKMSDITKPGIYICAYNNLEEMKDIPWGLAVFDECQNLKNADSQKTVYGKQIIANSDHTSMMSATPLDKGEHIEYICDALHYDSAAVLTDLGYQLDTIPIGGGRFIKQWRPHVQPSEIAKRLDSFFTGLTQMGLAVKREVSLSNLSVKVSRIPMPDNFMSRFNAAKDKYEMEVENASSKTRGMKTAQMLLGLRRLLEEGKSEHTVNSIKQSLKEGKQVVLFATRVNDSDIMDDNSLGTLKEISKQLDKAGIKHANVFDSKGGPLVKKFQEGELPVILTTGQSGGTGLNMDDTKGDKPRKAIIITPPFSAMEFIQMAGRINRLTTKSKAEVEMLVTDTDIDQWNKDIISNKLANLGGVVSGDYAKLSLDDVEAVQYMSDAEVMRYMAGKEAPTVPVGAEPMDVSKFKEGKTEEIKKALVWLMKSKAYPIGTVRTWGGVKYKKVSKTEWKKVTEEKQARSVEAPVFYHGTHMKFDAFLPYDKVPEEVRDVSGQHTFGTYFTDNRKLAKQFGDIVMKRKLSIKKPMDVSSVKSFEELTTKLGLNIEANKNKLENMAADSYFGDFGGEHESPYRAIEALNDKFKIADTLKQQGYDSLIFSDSENGVAGKTIVVFDVKNINADVVVSEPEAPYSRAEVIRSKAFKGWFGDWEKGEGSRVVDKNGEPQSTNHMEHAEGPDGNPVRVYHGTPAGDFTEFEKSKCKPGLYGKGFYFTEDKSVAEGYETKELFDQKLTDPDAILEIVHDLSRQVDEKVVSHYISEYEGKSAQTWLKEFSLEKYPPDESDANPQYNPMYGNVSYLSGLADQPYNIDVKGTVLKHAKLSKGKVFECFLNIRKPFDIDKDLIDTTASILASDTIDGEHRLNENIKFAMGQMQEGIKAIKGEIVIAKIGSKDPEIFPEDRAKFQKELEKSKARLQRIEKRYTDFAGGRVDYDTMKGVTYPERIEKYLREQGYDGITHIGGQVSGGKKHRVWIAFEPTQIKSVDAKEFDPKSPNIYKARLFLRVLDKAKKFPIGTIRHWKDGDYKKVGENKWERVTEEADYKQEADKWRKVLGVKAPKTPEAAPAEKLTPEAEDLKAEILASTVNLEYQKEWEEKNKLTLAGQHVENWQDIGYLAQVYRNPQYETFRVFFLDDDNTIKAQSGISSRLPASSAVYIDKPGEEFKWFKDIMKESGATKYVLLHNHPSGEMSFSGVDIETTKALSDNVPGMVGHILINHDKYAFAEGQPKNIRRQFFPDKVVADWDTTVTHISPSEQDKYVRKDVAYPGIGVAVHNPDTLLELVKHQEHCPENYVTLIGTYGVAGEVRAIMRMPKAWCKGTQSEKGLDAIHEFAVNTGSSQCFIAGLNNTEETNPFVKKAFKHNYVTDIVTEDNISLFEKLSYAPEKGFRLGVPSSRIADIRVDYAPGIKKSLGDGIKINREYDIPYLAGYSKDGKMIYIDRHCPEYKGKFPLVQCLAVHERTEKDSIDREGYKYQKAYRKALKAERKAVERAGWEWKAYQAYLKPYIKNADHEKLERVPNDLDLTPYQDEKDYKKLREMKKVNGVKKSLMLVMKAKQPNPRNAAEQRKVGMKIETEHTDDPKETDKIHRDHTKEFKDYYTRLVAMEDQAKKDRKRPQIELDLMEWLNKNPNPTDSKVHALAERWKVNPHQLERAIYRLATERAAFTKSKAYPIGTVRNWKGVAYEKKGKGDWRPVAQGRVEAPESKYGGRSDAFSQGVLSLMRKEIEKYIPKSALKGMWVWGSKLGARKNYEFHLPKSETFPDGVYIHVGQAEDNADAKVKGLDILLSRYDGRFDDIKDLLESPEAEYGVPSVKAMALKQGEYVSIEGVGVGTVEVSYPDGAANIKIADKIYYRSGDETDVKRATRADYWSSVLGFIEAFKAQSSSKRKEAAEYNRETEGRAVSRKGKVGVVAGNYSYAVLENPVSTVHRELLTDAKKAKALVDKLSAEIKWRKSILAEKLGYGLELSPEEKAEVAVLKVKAIIKKSKRMLVWKKS